MEDIKNVVYNLNAGVFVSQVNNQLNENFDNVYIPYKLFNKIYSHYNWFGSSRLLGLYDNKLYFLSKVNMTQSHCQPSNTGCALQTDAYVYKVLVLDIKDYSYFHTVIPDRLYKKYLCLNQTTDNLCVGDAYDRLNMFFINANLDINSNYSMHVGTSYLDDFMYSTKSTDIFIMGLYFFIPLLLFILAIKVLRKGLFK